MSTLTKHQKDFIYQQVARKARILWDHMESGSSCLQWMEAGVVYLNSHNIEAIPACGSASFQIMEDNGSDATHLSFEWQGPKVGARAAPVSGVPLPEMHCFIWLPESKEIVDFSTKYLPRFADKIGFKFAPGFEPPDYYWGDPNRLAPRAIYIPNVDATKLAIKFMRHQKGMR